MKKKEEKDLLHPDWLTPNYVASIILGIDTIQDRVRASCSHTTSGDISYRIFYHKATIHPFKFSTKTGYSSGLTISVYDKMKPHEEIVIFQDGFIVAGTWETELRRLFTLLENYIEAENRRREEIKNAKQKESFAMAAVIIEENRWW